MDMKTMKNKMICPLAPVCDKRKEEGHCIPHDLIDRCPTSGKRCLPCESFGDLAERVAVWLGGKLTEKEILALFADKWHK